MHAMLRSSTRFLDRPLSLASRGVVLLGIVALVAGAFLPLWRIQLVAPQYQEGLTLRDVHPQDHRWQRWPGPGRDQHAQPLHRDEADRAGDFAEMTWMPFAIGIFACSHCGPWSWAASAISSISGVLFIYFGAFSLGTFAYRLWSYGHHLSPDAPMHIAPFTPIVVGRQQIANFVQTSIPMSGTACMGLFLVAILFAIWMSRQEEL